jgi:hypothetical protein
MFIDVIDWDDEDDPKGNLWHIIGPGEVTKEEVEEVLHDYEGDGHRPGPRAAANPPNTGARGTD